MIAKFPRADGAPVTNLPLSITDRRQGGKVLRRGNARATAPIGTVRAAAWFGSKTLRLGAVGVYFWFGTRGLGAIWARQPRAPTTSRQARHTGQRDRRMASAVAGVRHFASSCPAIARKKCVGRAMTQRKGPPASFGNTNHGAIGRERAPCSDGKNMGSEDRPQIHEGVQQGDARAPVDEGRSRSTFAPSIG
jgi:hypothetical protein